MISIFKNLYNQYHVNYLKTYMIMFLCILFSFCLNVNYNLFCLYVYIWLYTCITALNAILSLMSATSYPKTIEGVW